MKNAKLAPFDSSDWNAFSGCESKHPEVAYFDGPDEDETAALVLDGTVVQLMVGTVPDTYSATFKTAALARLVAEHLCEAAAYDTYAGWDEDSDECILLTAAKALGLVLV